MTIPLSTTTITVLRLPAIETPGPGEEWLDPYDAQPARTEVATGVRAHFSSPTGREIVQGGEQERVDFVLLCDTLTVGLNHLDEVEDETTGELYEVVWARRRIGLGLDHIEAGVRAVEWGS